MTIRRVQDSCTGDLPREFSGEPNAKIHGKTDHPKRAVVIDQTGKRWDKPDGGTLGPGTGAGETTPLRTQKKKPREPTNQHRPFDNH